MRDFRLQTAINLGRLLWRREMGIGRLFNYLKFWALPGRKKIIFPNKMFDLADIPSVKNEIFKMAKYEPRWFPKLFEPTTLGIRAWEYGILMKNIKFKGKKVLDVGVGSSLLPKYLDHLGANVTAVDLEKPMEKIDGVSYTVANMTKLPFKKNSFDVVISVSAIEHLDADYPSNKTVSRKLFLERTEKALAEMKRVCKPGGKIFITTDFYLSRQKTDNWKTQVKYKNIGGAYMAEEIALFGQPYFDWSALITNPNRANYRGRFFTTVCFLYEKDKD